MQVLKYSKLEKNPNNFVHFMVIIDDQIIC